MPFFNPTQTDPKNQYFFDTPPASDTPRHPRLPPPRPACTRYFKMVEFSFECPAENGSFISISSCWLKRGWQPFHLREAEEGVGVGGGERRGCFFH
jgi:hypothetical protein